MAHHRIPPEVSPEQLVLPFGEVRAIFVVLLLLTASLSLLVLPLS